MEYKVLRVPVLRTLAAGIIAVLVFSPIASHPPEDAGVVGGDDTGSGAVPAGYGVSAPVHTGHGAGHPAVVSAEGGAFQG